MVETRMHPWDSSNCKMAALTSLNSPAPFDQNDTLTRLTQRFDVAIMADRVLTGPVSLIVLPSNMLLVYLQLKSPNLVV